MLSRGRVSLHDLVDPLHEILDDTVRSDLDLEACRDSMRFDAWNRVASYLLYFCLLFWCPLGVSTLSLTPNSMPRPTIEAQNCPNQPCAPC